MDDKERTIREHRLKLVGTGNPYGLEVYEQETSGPPGVLRELKNRLAYKLRGFRGKEAWLELDKTYRDNFLSQMFNCEHVLMLDVLNRYKPAAVTEIACGWGKNLKLIFDHVPSVKFVTAMDLSPDSLEHCREVLAGKNVRCIQADFDSVHGQPLDDWALVFNSLMYCEPKALERLLGALSRKVKYLLIMREPACASGRYRIRSEISFFHNYGRLLEKHDFEKLRLKNDTISLLVKFQTRK